MIQIRVRRMGFSNRAWIAGAARVGLVVAGLLGCTPGSRSETRATHPSAGAAGQPTSGVSAPTLFAPGVISDANRQWRITFTPDGRTAYFGESEGFFPATRQATIYVTHSVNGSWTTPVVAPFSGIHSDIDPFITPDGQRLYFSSIRPVDGVLRGDIDIWYVERTSSGWGPAVRLGDEVNSPMDELYPSASARGDLVFGVGPPAPTASADWDIYYASRLGNGFSPRRPIAVVNTHVAFDATNPTADWEFNPEVSSDGRTLVFTSLRPGGYGYGDLYVSHLRDDTWSAPRNLGPAVNTAADEFHPTLGPGGLLYFVRNSFGPTNGDIFVIEASSVDVLRPERGAPPRRP